MSAPWWQEAVFYQVYPRSFQDADGDGMGDLTGVTRRLSYLRESLGIDVVWLSPFYRSPMRDMGYDVSDHCDVDPSFGTLADFDELLAEAHRLGLRVVIDFVPNHTSSDHPWFRASAARNGPTADWYVWRDGRDGGPPNNWLSIFGGSSWTWHEGRQQYYLHSFLPEQPDLDWRNPEVKEAMFGVIDFWLDRGVDGFRIDVAHFIGKDPALRDNPPNPAGRGDYHKPLGEYETQLHQHDQGHPDAHHVYAELRERITGREREPVLLGEIHIAELDRWASYYGTWPKPELHLPFNFGLLRVPFSATEVASHIRAMERVTASADRFPTYVLGNHDEPRLRSRVGAQRLRAAAALLLTLRGVPTLYYGDEIGMPQVDVPPSRLRDPWGERVPGHDLCRDGARTPMRWDDSPGAGFTSDDGRAWLPLGPRREVNVTRQLAAPNSLLNAYRALLSLRRELPALRRGSLQALDAREDRLSYERQDGDEIVGIEMNLGEAPAETRYPTAPLWLRLADAIVDLAPGDGGVPTAAPLAPGEVRIHRL